MWPQRLYHQPQRRSRVIAHTRGNLGFRAMLARCSAPRTDPVVTKRVSGRRRSKRGKPRKMMALPLLRGYLADDTRGDASISIAPVWYTQVWWHFTSREGRVSPTFCREDTGKEENGLGKGKCLSPQPPRSPFAPHANTPSRISWQCPPVCCHSLSEALLDGTSAPLSYW